MGNVDDFVAGLEPEPQRAFTRIVAVAMVEAPDAAQGTSYGMPALKYRGKPLVGLAEAQSHLSLFPFSPAVVNKVRDRLDGYSLSKGTIRFSADRPLPDDVVRDVVRLRRAEIDAKQDDT
ncbi:MAG: iron chaperone [Actinomycetes bacterium]